jgi:hypothetical protein
MMRRALRARSCGSFVLVDFVQNSIDSWIKRFFQQTFLFGA